MPREKVEEHEDKEQKDRLRIMLYCTCCQSVGYQVDCNHIPGTPRTQTHLHTYTHAHIHTHLKRICSGTSDDADDDAYLDLIIREE